MSAPLQVAFLTGQSAPESCALSPRQLTFLERLPVPEAGRVRRNFPYELDTPPHRDVPLVIASWNNARQYLGARAPTFAERYRPVVLSLLGQAERTVLLAGSCGLELLARLRLPDTALQRVHVFAYGSVARLRPRCDILTVQGRDDWVARVWGGKSEVTVAGGHLSYLDSSEVLALCVAFLERVRGRA